MFSSLLIGIVPAVLGITGWQSDTSIPQRLKTTLDYAQGNRIESQADYRSDSAPLQNVRSDLRQYAGDDRMDRDSDASQLPSSPRRVQLDVNRISPRINIDTMTPDVRVKNLNLYQQPSNEPNVQIIRPAPVFRQPARVRYQRVPVNVGVVPTANVGVFPTANVGVIPTARFPIGGLNVLENDCLTLGNVGFVPSNCLPFGGANLLSNNCFAIGAVPCTNSFGPNFNCC